LEQIKDQRAPIKKMCEGEQQFFFGYYDIQPWDINNRYHLACAANFMDRLPENGDRAQVGYIDAEKGTFISIDSTSAWNFQQSTMLRWNPQKPDREIIYNIRNGQNYASKIKNIITGEERIIDRPLANIDSKGNYGLSIDFSRIFDFRPGYGYAEIKDKNVEIQHPSDDGIFLVNLRENTGKLIISYEELWQKFSKDTPLSDRKILINHINFNQDGTRFVFLCRTFPTQTEPWKTITLTANTDGTDIYCLTDYSYASHYNWRDNENLLIYTVKDGVDGLYLLKDKTQDYTSIDRNFFAEDGHCSYSPDKKWILYDSYPDKTGYRNLFLYDLENSKGIKLAALYSDPIANGDIRCDLHPRWNRLGNMITFDSTHECHRYIYSIDLKSVFR